MKLGCDPVGHGQGGSEIGVTQRLEQSATLEADGSYALSLRLPNKQAIENLSTTMAKLVLASEMD